MGTAQALDQFKDLPRSRLFRQFAYPHTSPADAVAQAVAEYRAKHGEPRGAVYYYAQRTQHVSVWIEEV